MLTDYIQLQEKEVHRAKEEKRRREKKLRRKQDALKSSLKRLKPSIEPTSTWEDHEGTITQLPEYHDLKDESLAKEVFDKFLIRLTVCMKFQCRSKQNTLSDRHHILTHWFLGKGRKETNDR